MASDRRVLFPSPKGENGVPIAFRVQRMQEGARRGVLETPHGSIQTPAFMPVGTQATVKAMTPEELQEIGYGLILANTYHLYLRPGAELVAAAGGLHRFMHWSGAILTDSGGFQVFSLSPLRDVSEEGVRFRSHIDGSTHFLSPEKVIEVEEALGADIIMPLDECLPYPVSREEAAISLARTTRWAQRCWHALQTDQALFGIVQGATYPELRAESARQLVALDLPGYAVGGLSVGEPKEIMYDILGQTTACLPPEKPRYLMGVGSPEDLVEGVARGVDLFDCVLPTRIARHGSILTRQGRLSLRNARFKDDWGPPDPDCHCYVCRNYSRGYLRHLFTSDEILGLRLATYHNLAFLYQEMEEIRQALDEGSFAAYRQAFLARYGGAPRVAGNNEQEMCEGG
ncbi:MAG: tRNA guanosine(34) transglycosylase Tgt [Limnochordaceae bacterium]|nr:tRNA guanosine(34) transglycosylase Tgt [Limnochordaceae bacterium]